MIGSKSCKKLRDAGAGGTTTTAGKTRGKRHITLLL
jgi:hypothetical protein